MRTQEVSDEQESEAGGLLPKTLGRPFKTERTQGCLRGVRKKIEAYWASATEPTPAELHSFNKEMMESGFFDDYGYPLEQFDLAQRAERPDDASSPASEEISAYESEQSPER